MGVYIKDMEMPKGCLLCRFFDPIHEVCLGMERAEKTILSDKYKHPACPLVEVPLHGRLIDADCCNGYFYEHMSDDMMIAAMNAINEMPTIIESDGD